MGIDTVKLRSPVIDEGTASFLERQSILKQGVDLSSGEILYELTTGQLEGSWDSRISFRVMREDWISDGRSVQLESCPPYVIVEASLHKFFYGQNIYGKPRNFSERCRLFVNFLGEMFGCDHGMFTEAAKWEVRRVDWAEVFRLSPAAQVEFFRMLKNARFPRRAMKEAKYATAVHFPGAFTTLRIYSKGPEFREHDKGRIRTALVKYQRRQNGDQVPAGLPGLVNPKVVIGTKVFEWIERKVAALGRLADNRLRAEIQINADKLHRDFGGRFPLVSDMTDGYLEKVYQAEMFKLLKEGKSAMETVRTYDAVKARLNALFGTRAANNLLAFWMQLAARGEAVVIDEYSKSQFYANRKKLVDAGISWNSSDVFIVPQDTALPRDFKPLPSDSRRCLGAVSANSIFNLCPVQYAEMKRAA